VIFLLLVYSYSFHKISDVILLFFFSYSFSLFQGPFSILFGVSLSNFLKYFMFFALKYVFIYFSLNPHFHISFSLRLHEIINSSLVIFYPFYSYSFYY
jgi:hypothetical protein